MSASVAVDARAAWLAWRQRGLGGSDAAVIAGLSPWKSPYVLWLEKTGQLPVDGEESEAMRWGTLLEPVIADEFERRTGLFVTQRQRLVEHPEEPWRRATLDGLVVESAYRRDEAPAEQCLPDEPVGIYEGKTTSALRHALDWSEGIPDHYQLQVQHNLAVTGLDNAWVTCLVGGQRLAIYEVARDQDLIDELVELEREFWKRVESGEPPPVDASPHTTAAIKEAFALPTPGRTIDLPDDVRPYLYSLAEGKALKKQAEGLIEEAQNALMAALGDAECALMDGREVVTWKGYERRELDRKALCAEMPEVAAKYTRTVALRQFRLKEDEL